MGGGVAGAVRVVGRQADVIGVWSPGAGVASVRGRARTVTAMTVGDCVVGVAVGALVSPSSGGQGRRFKPRKPRKR